MSGGMDEPDVARFWARIARGTPDSCWEWQSGFTDSGYGQFYFGGSDVGAKAHRVAYELSVGTIPDGMVIRHKCDNRRCCNPNHLEPGTLADNNRDRVARGRNGDNSGKAIGGRKLTLEQVEFIRASRGTVLQRELGAMFGVTQNLVSKIQLGRNWK